MRRLILIALTAICSGLILMQISTSDADQKTCEAIYSHDACFQILNR